MVLSKLHGKAPSPADMAKKWAFNEDGEILWTLSDFAGMGFKKRGYVYNAEEIKEYAQSEQKGVILQVNHSHWIAVAGVSDGKLVVHDPIDGNVYTGVPSRYTVTGYALFEKTEKKSEVSDYAKESVAKAMASGVATGWDTPQRIVADSEAETMLMRVGALKRPAAHGGVTKEDFVVALDRLGLLE